MHSIGASGLLFRDDEKEVEGAEEMGDLRSGALEFLRLDVVGGIGLKEALRPMELLKDPREEEAEENSWPGVEA